MKKNKPSGPPPPPIFKPLEVEMPGWLKDIEARAEFRRVVAILGNKVTALDQSLLADYASSYAEILDLDRAVKAEGRLLTGAKGGLYTNPTVNMLQGVKAHMAALRRDLFFTPKSRNEKQKSQSKAKSMMERLDAPNET